MIACLIFGMRTYDRLRREEGRSAPISAITSLVYAIAWVGGLWLLVHYVGR
jgi:hypothetical protein